MDYARFLFSFKGRINRAPYLAVQLALLTFWFIFFIYFSPQWKDLHFDWAVAIAMIWINAAAVVKRLHDRNRSGWWAVPILILNRLCFAYYGLFFAKELLLVLLAVALSLLQTWVVIELFFLMGTDGPNRFGPDPTRTALKSPIVSRPEPFGVPDFLLHRAGPRPT
jgi:uncharacterized membrane protein YhaH (DUF805 family)